MDEHYVSPGPKRRIEGFWMPRDVYEELLDAAGAATAFMHPRSLNPEMEAARKRLRAAVDAAKSR